MASMFSDAFKTFWHAMTSYDRHATHDTASRLSRTSTNTALSAVVSSRTDIDPLYGEDYNQSTAHLHTSNGYVPSANPGYVPGQKTAMVTANAVDGTVDGPGDVQLQNFANGVPPALPVLHSWKRIDRWAEDNYQELFDQLCEPATMNDLNELEHELDCTLPQDVRDSIMVHDGQERGGRPTGIIFGCMLLDCEEIIQEWNQWKTVNEQYQLNNGGYVEPPKAISSSSVSSQSSANNPYWRHDLLAKQESIPPNTIQKAYFHPGWIPLVRDWGGNNLAVDLAPGPSGKWGQIILFGRDYDTKYVIARSWAAFLANLSDDLNSGKWWVDEDSGELKLREFKADRVEPDYLDILRWRIDMRNGGARRPRRGPPPHRHGTQSPPTGIRAPVPRFVAAQPGKSQSPGGSPRIGPRAHVLARVNEERIPGPSSTPPPTLPRSDSEPIALDRVDSGEVRRPLISDASASNVDIPLKKDKERQKESDHSTKESQPDSKDGMVNVGL